MGARVPPGDYTANAAGASRYARPPQRGLEVGMTYPFVVAPVVGDEAELPAMFEVRQHFDVLPAVDVLAALEDEWPRTKAPLSALAPGASVAVSYTHLRAH